MRIVAGRHRGRRIAAPPGLDVRPTADRVRQAVFDILEHAGLGPGGGSAVAGARVLDGFAGTGALGLEALSRGAAHATFLDTDARALAACRANARRLGEEARAEVRRGDCLRPDRARARCRLIFLDPPYGAGLAGAALAALAAAGWIAPGAVCVVETGVRETFGPPPGFAPLDTRVYGAARITILRFGEAAPDGGEF